MRCVYILEINPLSVVSFVIILSNSKGCLFTLFIVSFTVQKLLSLIMSQLFTFAFISVTLGGGSRESNGNPLQYSCLENPMDGEAWYAAVHGVARNRTQLSDFTFTFHFHALEKEMVTHSSVLAWRIPGMAEPGRLPSMGSHRVRHD